MKKIFTYLGIILSVALMGVLTGCNPTEIEESADLGLGIKVFFPTKVVAGQPMTINGSGFSDVREIVFPNGVTVTNFELVSNDMIRVNAPSGISAEGGYLIVRSADEEAESRVPLTLGYTKVSGYSKQDGESITGGEQLTVYGEDLEFVSSVELLDEEGNPLILQDEQFYRKGSNSIIFVIPRKTIYTGTFVGKLYTIDGREFLLPELSYEPASDGGHWETKEVVYWENDDPDGHGGVNWNGTYRFAGDGFSTGEEIYTFPTDVWGKIKSEPFYVLLAGENPQIRVTTGWWSTTWTGNDIQPGNELLTDNGDGTWTLAVDLSGDPDLLALLDAQHLLFTGGGYTPLKIYTLEDEWIDGGGHSEIVKTSVWQNDDPDGHGGVNWNGTYRFAGEGHSTGEEIYTIPADLWEKIKSEPFYVLLTGENPQIRVTTGWWSITWTGNDIQPGNELLTDNGDGTWTLAVDLSGDADLLALLDDQHLLFTGGGYTPLEIYFEEEIWVDGDDSGPEEVVIWENGDPDGNGLANWNGTYRFAADGHSTGEEIYTIPADQWEKIKSEPFYVLLTGENPQIRVTTGWWSITWTGNDIQPGNELLTDNGDGTWTLAVDLSGDADLLALLDDQHLLFTGGGFTPLKLFYYK